MSKIKILVFGPIVAAATADDGSVATTSTSTFLSKLCALQKSKAGPFDAAFVIGGGSGGSSSMGVDGTVLPALLAAADRGDDGLPVCVYLHDDYYTAALQHDPTIEPLLRQKAHAIIQEAKEERKQQEETGLQHETENENTNTTTTTTSGRIKQEESSTNDKRLLGCYPCLKLSKKLVILRDYECEEFAADSATTTTPTTVLSSLTAAAAPAAAGIWSLPVAAGKPELVVACCPVRFQFDKESSAHPLLEKLQHVSYTGCDLLLTTEWPQGMEQLVVVSSTTTKKEESSSEQQLALQDACYKLVSYDIGYVALQARARYHFASGPLYWQSPPFCHLAATTNTVSVQHVGRFLSLAPTTTPTSRKGGGAAAATNTKFVHALGLTPLHSMSYIELEEQRPATALPCPFTDASYQTTGNVPSNIQSNSFPSIVPSAVVSGLSEASARRILAEERRRNPSGITAPAQRWATNGPHNNSNNNNKRPLRAVSGADMQQGDGDDDQSQIDPTNTSLFVHGLHKDVTGLLQSQPQGNVTLLQAFSKFGAMKVRKPPNAPTSSFAFVDFPSHEAAAYCLEQTGLDVFEVNGVHLTVKWASHGNNNKKTKQEPTDESVDNPHHQHGNKRQRLTEAEARDSSTVYYKLPRTVTEEQYTVASESLRQWMETTLEDALGAADEDASGGENVTAATEPALQVQLRMPSNNNKKDVSYGFLDFASHAAASMALATLTGSTDGGEVLADAPSIPAVLQGHVEQKMYLHWASGKVEMTHANSDKRKERDFIEDASGFRFERKHFPPDSRQDCWFCLASESCEKHLITGVYNQCYSAMPKGPVHEGHVLLIPVQHSSQGAWKDPELAQEMEDIKKRLCQHAHDVYQSDLFVFERAIQTKGGYHTHVQCVPVPKNIGPRLQLTMESQARKAGMVLRELNTDLALSSVLANANTDDRDTDGYFYAEISSLEKETKRFLHHATLKQSTPLQFGREVLAAVLEKPELAHWKSCVADKDTETSMAAAFRESFSKYEEKVAFCADVVVSNFS